MMQQRWVCCVVALIVAVVSEVAGVCGKVDIVSVSPSGSGDAFIWVSTIDAPECRPLRLFRYSPSVGRIEALAQVPGSKVVPSGWLPPVVSSPDGDLVCLGFYSCVGVSRAFDSPYEIDVLRLADGKVNETRRRLQAYGPGWDAHPVCYVPEVEGFVLVFLRVDGVSGRESDGRLVVVSRSGDMLGDWSFMKPGDAILAGGVLGTSGRYVGLVFLSRRRSGKDVAVCVVGDMENIWSGVVVSRVSELDGPYQNPSVSSDNRWFVTVNSREGDERLWGTVWCLRDGLVEADGPARPIGIIRASDKKDWLVRWSAGSDKIVALRRESGRLRVVLLDRRFRVLSDRYVKVAGALAPGRVLDKAYYFEKPDCLIYTSGRLSAVVRLNLRSGEAKVVASVPEDHSWGALSAEAGR